MGDGNPYELLTQEVFQALLDRSELRGVEVQHNVILEGKDTPTHQIDVFWTFDVAGIQYQNVTQAKDWKTRVPQEKLHAFKTVLNDLPGQPRGIYVARRGYQRGATTFAKKNGIVLYQLEEVDRDGPLFDLEVTTLGYAAVKAKRAPLFIAGAGREGYSLIAEATVFEPEFRDSLFNVDLPWLCKKYGLQPDEAKRRVVNVHIHAPPQDIKLHDENGDESGTVLAVYKGFVDQIIGKEGKRHKLAHQFDKPTFLHTSDRDLPSLNIQSITSTVTIKKKRRMERPFRLPNVTLCVLRNVSDGTVWLVGKRTTPSEIEAESRSDPANNATVVVVTPVLAIPFP